MQYFIQEYNPVRGLHSVQRNTFVKKQPSVRILHSSRLSLLCLTNATLRVPVCDRVMSQQLSEGLVSVRRKEGTGKKRWEREWRRLSWGAVKEVWLIHSSTTHLLTLHVWLHLFCTVVFFPEGQKEVWSWAAQSKADLFMPLKLYTVHSTVQLEST